MELRDYLNVIRARKWIIIEAVIIVTLVTFLVSYLQKPTYAGRATVLITERDTGAALLGASSSDFANPVRGFDTQVQLIKSRPILEGAIRKLNLQMTPAELADKVDVTPVTGTNVLYVSVEDGDAQRAADMANAIAQGYVDWSMESKRSSIKNAADQIQARLDEAKTEILALGQKLANNPRTDRNGQPIKDDQLTAELDIATGLYSTLAEKLETLRVNEQLERGSGEVVALASVDPEKVAPSPKRDAALGLVIGLVIGVAMALLMEYLDNTIKSAEEAEKIFGAPVLGEIPLEQFGKDESRRLTIIQHPGSPTAESYRGLRNSLDFINFERDIKTVLVSSPAPSEGKSTVAANLAAALAQTGKKVVLMSCDFRRPTTEHFFNVQNAPGLSDVLTGKHPLKSSLQRPGDDQLLVLTSGKMPPNPSELLGSQRMKEVIESLEEWADWVIIDTPPLLAVADSASIVRWADGVLMVTRAGSATRDAARRAHQMLDKVGARVLGVIVWGLEEAGSSSGYYSGYYGYYGVHTSKAEMKQGKSASAPDAASAEMSFEPPVSTGRKIAALLGRIMALLLGFLIVLILLVAIAFWLDAFYGMGIVRTVTGVLGM